MDITDLTKIFRAKNKEVNEKFYILNKGELHSMWSKPVVSMVAPKRLTL